MDRGEVRGWVYQFIIQFIQKNGYPPTVREICDGLYLSSTETVHYQLTVLEKEGLIKRKKDSPRAIQVLGYRFVKE